jgi:hypothetical protein
MGIFAEFREQVEILFSSLCLNTNVKALTFNLILHADT